MRRKLVVGNWKMNGSIASNKALLGSLLEGLRDYRNADYVVCVPYPYLCQAQDMLKGSNIAWGAQNICSTRNGALTGAVSPQMVLDYGCTHIIVGHSERRIQFHETDDTAAARFLAALDAGLTPIFCMGESLEERESDWTDYIVGRGMRFFLVAALMAWGGARMEQMLQRYVDWLGWLTVALLLAAVLLSRT